MYYARPVARRCPATIRVVQPTRNATFFPSPFVSRSPAADFNSLFHAFDELTSPRALSFDNVFGPAYAQLARHQLQHSQHFAINPRFDVQETEDNYELRGEIPGVESQDLNVEFTDPQTLTIRGQTTRESTSGTSPAAVQAQPEAATTEEAQTQAVTIDAEVTQEDNNSDAASTYSTGSYQKPSVEDSEVDAAESSSDAQARATPTTSEAPAAEKQEVAKTQPTEQQPQPESQQQPKSRYWVSERSTGSFQRTFKFPGRVDQDAVKASLKNGILSIVVPKASAPVAKSITVE